MPKANDRKDGQIAENVVAALQRWTTVPGASITQKASVPVYDDPTEQRDVDVLVSIPIGGKTITIGVEVKDHGRPIDVGDLGQIVDLAREVRLSHYCVISTSGYTEGAEKKARRDGIELMTMEEFEQSEFFVSPRGSLSFEVGGTLVNMQFVYRTLPPKQAPTPNPRQVVTLADFQIEGPGQSLLDLINSKGREIAMAQHRQLVDQQQFDVMIRLPSGYWTRITKNGEDVPVPDAILATYTFFRRSLPEYRFRVKGLEMSTTQVNIGGELRQVTVAAIPASGGGFRLSFVTGPVKPKKNKGPTVRKKPKKLKKK